jgi:(p)ppGpp synthase/HD superfamily hydrolase
MKKKKAATLEQAIAIAVEAHAGQRDKNGAPYILHPLRVMFRVQIEAERIAAVLHDVVEDTDWTLSDLRKEGFSDQIVAAVDCLTKREGEEYEDYIRRAASNPLARKVKLGDLEDNMDVRRLSKVDRKATQRLAKYLKAWQSLQNE